MNIEQEKESLEQATVTSRLMADVLQRHDAENKRLWIAVIISICVNVIMAFCMVFFSCNMQSSFDKAMLEALNSVGDVTTTTVEQDTGSGSGNNVYQSGENAAYTQGGAE